MRMRSPAHVEQALTCPTFFLEVHGSSGGRSLFLRQKNHAQAAVV